MTRAIRYMIIYFLLLVFCDACGAKEVDYGDALAFEKALNDGENVIGKTVSFDVIHIQPFTEFGYNIWSGEHLYFCSPENWNVEPGNILTAKVLSVATVGDSYIIRYKMLSEIEEKTRTEMMIGHEPDSEINIYSDDRSLAGNIYMAFTVGMLDPDVVVAKDYDDSLELLKKGVDITSYAGPYEMGKNSIFYEAAEILKVEDFSEFSNLIETPGVSGKIFVYLGEDNKIRVEIDGTDIVVDAFEDYL